MKRKMSEWKVIERQKSVAITAEQGHIVARVQGMTSHTEDVRVAKRIVEAVNAHEQLWAENQGYRQALRQICDLYRAEQWRLLSVYIAQKELEIRVENELDKKKDLEE